MIERTQQMLNRQMFMIGLSLILGGGGVAGCSPSSVENSDIQAPLAQETTPLAPAKVSEADSSASQKNNQSVVAEGVSGAAPEVVSQAIASTPSSTGDNTKDNASEQQWTSDPMEVLRAGSIPGNFCLR